MLSLKSVASKSRSFNSPLQFIKQTIISTSSSSTPSTSTSFNTLSPSASPSIDANGIGSFQSKEVVFLFKEWFKSRSNALLDRIFQILSTHDDSGDDVSSFPRSVDLELSRLGLRLNEQFVLGVLNYDKNVLSCLKFFDWAGRQPGFQHTRATFNAIFKILSRAKLMSLMMDFLNNYTIHRYVHKVRFYDTLVMGYAVAGKPDIALQLFGKMRFRGLDLDKFTYHVLLNALVEESYFDAVIEIAKQIKKMGYENEVTHAIIVKSLCKQKKADEAEEYLRVLLKKPHALSGQAVSIVVDTLCKLGDFERAGTLVEVFRESGLVPMKHAYNLWIRDLVQAGKLTGALEFLEKQKLQEGYVPDVFRYNVLICRLLRESRLEELFDLLMEMKESRISPDKVTMNAALCFFCKAGMVDVALELYNAGDEFGLSPNCMAYNYLINTLCLDGSIYEAYKLLKNAISQGYFPGGKTFSILAENLCKEGKLDMMKELFVVALEHNFTPSDYTYDMFISALCRAKRVEDGYLIHGELNRLNQVTTKRTYYNLIHGFNKSNRGDIAARLLIEMQEKGHEPSRSLFRPVIGCLCETENPETQFFKLLEMQISRDPIDCKIYNHFIDGAGHAKKPDLAREVFEIMGRNGITPNMSSDILVLQSYIKSDRFSDAVKFFNEIRKRRKPGRKLYNTMVVGLSKANKFDIAMEFFTEMRVNDAMPSIECYEELIRVLCSNERYDLAVELIKDLEKCGRRISSFIGNVLLLHSLKSQELYKSLVRLREETQHENNSHSAMLGELIQAFSTLKLGEHVEDLEKLIESCFPLDIYTHNMLLRRLSSSEMDYACEYFDRLRQKGYEPNRWTYDVLAHGLFKHGRRDEGRRCIEEMYRKGFVPTEVTKVFI